MREFVSMFLHARSSKQPFTDIPVMNQTNWYYDFSRFIEDKIHEGERKQLEQNKKETKKLQSKNQTSQKKRR